jgi:hypothetical protein
LGWAKRLAQNVTDVEFLFGGSASCIAACITHPYNWNMFSQALTRSVNIHTSQGRALKCTLLDGSAVWFDFTGGMHMVSSVTRRDPADPESIEDGGAGNLSWLKGNRDGNRE